MNMDGIKRKPRANPTSCGALAFRKNKEKDTWEILLIQQSIFYDNWSIPKGHIQEGETFEECAMRETLEETGIPVKLLKKYPAYTVRSGPEMKTLRFWTAEPLSTAEPDATGEHSEVYAAGWHDVKWLPPISKLQKYTIETMIKEHIGIVNEPPQVEDWIAFTMSEAMLEIKDVYGDELGWRFFKSKILKRVGNRARVLFQRVHPDTKLILINDFERKLMKQWKQLTGKELIINPDELHSDEKHQEKLRRKREVDLEKIRAFNAARAAAKRG